MPYTKQELLERFKDNPTFVTFIKNMAKTGAELSVYSPRGGYGKEIPCAHTDETNTLQVLIRATRLTLRYDILGKNGHVVYP